MKVKDFIELLKNKEQEANINFYSKEYEEYLDLDSIEEYINESGKKIIQVDINLK